MIWIDLISEGVQEPDGIDLQDGMYRPRSCLQILENVVREKLDDIHECIGRRHTKLRGRSKLSMIKDQQTKGTNLRRGPPSCDCG
jgi:hypothetical protein